MGVIEVQDLTTWEYRLGWWILQLTLGAYLETCDDESLAFVLRWVRTHDRPRYLA